MAGPLSDIHVAKINEESPAIEICGLHVCLPIGVDTWRKVVKGRGRAITGHECPEG